MFVQLTLGAGKLTQGQAQEITFDEYRQRLLQAIQSVKYEVLVKQFKLTQGNQRKVCGSPLRQSPRNNFPLQSVAQRGSPQGIGRLNIHSKEGRDANNEG